VILVVSFVISKKHSGCLTFSRQLDVGYHVVMTAAIPDAMLLPTDECFAQEVPEHAYDGLTCLKGWGRHPSTRSYTWYWTLNNWCRQVIHKWRFESEMTIWSYLLNYEGQYLKWTCFTAKTGLVILWLNIHSLDMSFIWFRYVSLLVYLFILITLLLHITSWNSSLFLWNIFSE
jgi:hypothetical protein